MSLTAGQSSSGCQGALVQDSVPAPAGDHPGRCAQAVQASEASWASGPGHASLAGWPGPGRPACHQQWLGLSNGLRSPRALARPTCPLGPEGALQAAAAGPRRRSPAPVGPVPARKLAGCPGGSDSDDPAFGWRSESDSARGPGFPDGGPSESSAGAATAAAAGLCDVGRGAGSPGRGLAAGVEPGLCPAAGGLHANCKPGKLAAKAGMSMKNSTE